MAVTLFKVIVSILEQYSVWPAGVEDPLGWETDSVDGAPLAECLAYIGSVWRDEVEEEDTAFVVIINENDMLSVNLAGVENPEDWATASEPMTLEGCLAFIGDAWRGAGPLPEPFRPGTGESPEFNEE